MKIRKRYIFLILLCFLPLLELIHPDDYCFGDANLLIIGIYVIIFSFAFISIFFYNLYKISERRELFNYRPILIAAIYGVTLTLLLQFHNRNFFENKILFFKIEGATKPLSELTLYSNKSFKYKTISENNCFIKGKYQLKKDTLFLTRNQKTEDKNPFADIYFFNKKTGELVPKNGNYRNFKLEN